MLKQLNIKNAKSHIIKKDDALDVSWEGATGPDAEERLLDIYEFLLSDSDEMCKNGTMERYKKDKMDIYKRG